MSRVTGFAVAALSFLLVSGCGNDAEVYDDISVRDKTPDSTAFEGTMKYAVTQAETAPEERYFLIDNSRDMALLYYAYAHADGRAYHSAEYDAIAQSVSDEYRYAVDGFQKNDLLNKLIPEIRTGMERFSKNRFYAIDVPVSLGHYDFGDKTFPVSGIPQKNAGIYFQGNDFAVSFLNPGRFASVVVEREDRARRIEDLVSSNRRRVIARFFLFMQHSDTDNRRANFTVTRMRVRQADGSVLLDASI